jgi:predicted HAD superfamily Cof-like phosphohydrolase
MPEFDEDAWEASVYGKERDELLQMNKRLAKEVARLTAQVNELQDNNSKVVLARRADDVWMHAYEFHEALNLPRSHGPPRIPSTSQVRMRLLLSAEEFCEQLDACFHLNPAIRDALRDEILYSRIYRVDLVDIVDSWGDMNFVNNGSAVEFGVQLAPIAREVHRSNMTKRGALRNVDGKIMKGPNFEPPQIERLLREQGWDGSNIPEPDAAP